MFTIERAYKDFLGQERTEKFYFNFTSAELVAMRWSVNGGLEKQIEDIVAKQDGVQIMQIIRRLILGAYGEPSLDGREFVKSEEISKRFESTQAYSDLFMELVTDPAKAANFINSLIPDELKEEAAKAQREAVKNGKLPNFNSEA